MLDFASDRSLVDHDAQRLLRRSHWIPGCFMFRGKDSTRVEESVRSPLCLGDL